MEKGKKYYLLLPIRSVLFIGVFVMLTFLMKTDLTGVSRWWSVIVSIMNCLIIVMLFLVCRLKTITFGELIHYEKRKSGWKTTVLIVGLMILIGMGGMYLAGYLCYGVFPYMAPAMMVEPIPLVLAIMNLVILPITTTLAEDGLYLGIGVNHIKNKWLAIFLSAFFYAIQHSFMPTLWDVKYMLYRFLSFLPLTIWICWLYYKKRNPLPIMVGHGILNLATAFSILMTSAFPAMYEVMP